MGKHRSRLKILAKILSVVNDNEGAKKTQIMYQAYLSYKLLVQYLNDVLEAGLVVSENGSTYELTPKGQLFLSKFEDYVVSCKRITEHLDHIKDQRIKLNAMCPNNHELNSIVKVQKNR